MVFNPKVNSLQRRIVIRLEQALRLLVPSNISGDNISPWIFVSSDLLTGVFVPDKECPGSDNFLSDSKLYYKH